MSELKIRAVMGWLFTCVLLAIELARAISGHLGRSVFIEALELSAVCQLIQALRAKTPGPRGREFPNGY